MCSPSMNLPSLDHIAHNAQQWVTPELGLNSTGQGNPRLGCGYRKLHIATGRILSRGLLRPTTHRLSFPTCLLHPRRVHLHYYKSIGQYTSLTLGFNNRLD